MNIKKLAGRLISASLIISVLVGCSDEIRITSYESSDTKAIVETSPKIAKSDISAVLLLPDDPAKGACMSSAHEGAFSSAAKELGIKATVLPKVSEDSINEATDNYNVIFGAGYDYMNLLDDKAKANQNKLYACFGGYKYNSSNYANYYTAIYDAQYLAGVVAGANSKSGKIGVISEYTTEYPDSAAEINSFTLGARSVNPEAQVLVRSLGSRNDTSKAEDYTHALIAEKCDVISIQCDTTVPATVAISKNVHFIGYGIDMRDLHKELCLTSVIWDLSDYYRSALISASDGTWTAENYYGNLSDRAVFISELSEDAVSITETHTSTAAKLINGGEFEVFSNKKITYDAEGKATIVDAALIDNKSNTMISEDGTQCFLYSGEELISVDPAAVTSDNLASANMNYLVDGVLVRTEVK